MVFSLFGRNWKYINIEIKDHCIRYVELKQGAEPSVARCGEHYLPPGLIRNGKMEDYETLKTIMEQCVAEWKIARRQVCFLTPDHSIVLRKVLIDKTVKDDEIQGHLYLQLGTSIHLPFEEPVFDTVTLGEKDDQKEILLFAASEQQVSQYHKLLEDCKLDPVVADISSLAIYRLLHTLGQTTPEEHTMVLQWDLLNVNVSVFTDDKPNFMRHLQIPIDPESWDKTGMSEWVYQDGEDAYFRTLEDVYTEIDRVMSFYKYNLANGEYEVSKIIVAGDHPFLEKIIANLRERYTVPVSSVDYEGIQTESSDILPPPFALPVGLGLREGI